MSSALPLDIERLLEGRSVEWERLELKAGWNPLDVLHTLCAFANDLHNLGGGYVVIGVAEQDGRPVLPPVGLDPARLDAIQKELLNLGHTAITPPYHPLAVPVERDGRWILVIWAPGGQTRPYRARLSLAKDRPEQAWFIRKGSSTVRARGPDEAELLGLAATVPFDDRVNQRAHVDDLSRELMTAYLRAVGSDLADEAPSLPLEALGRQMHVVDGRPRRRSRSTSACCSSTPSRGAGSPAPRSTSSGSPTARAATGSPRRSSAARSTASSARRSTTSSATTSRRR
jgi:ATP-dependent DNA helicase RecG